jgi:hypothetical protein
MIVRLCSLSLCRMLRLTDHLSRSRRRMWTFSSVFLEWTLLFFFPFLFPFLVLFGFTLRDDGLLTPAPLTPFSFNCLGICIHMIHQQTQLKTHAFQIQQIRFRELLSTYSNY